MSTWHGLDAQAGTPEPIQKRLSASLRPALRDERLCKRSAEFLADPATVERASIGFHRRFIVGEANRWRSAIQAAGAYAD